MKRMYMRFLTCSNVTVLLSFSAFVDQSCSEYLLKYQLQRNKCWYFIRTLFLLFLGFNSGRSCRSLTVI